MGVFAQPAMPSNLEQVGTFPRVRDQYPSQQVSCMRCDVFGEGERGVDYVFVKKVDVIAFRVRWVVVER